MMCGFPMSSGISCMLLVLDLVPCRISVQETHVTSLWYGLARSCTWYWFLRDGGLRPLEILPKQNVNQNCFVERENLLSRKILDLLNNVVKLDLGKMLGCAVSEHFPSWDMMKCDPPVLDQLPNKEEAQCYVLGSWCTGGVHYQLP